MGRVARVAEAVAEELNAHTFSQSFTAEVLYLPLFELPDMNTLHVTVVPTGMKVAPLDRSRATHEVKVDVAVQQKLAAVTPEAVEPLVDLVEEIASFFAQRRLANERSAIWIGTEHSPLYAPEHLHELRQFTGVMTLQYKVME